MSKNTSISLGPHFESFISNVLAGGRYNNASEVVRAGLRLLESEEQRLAKLRTAIERGVQSGVVKDFNPEKHLAELKRRKKKDD
ncbi:MAG: type II toxin-antitoxin system ParD family antitoxin [Candidatus Kapaibacterium sp.]